MAINLRKILSIETDGEGIPSDPQCRRLLDNLQGNILKEHGRDNALLFFLTFKTERITAAKKLLAQIFADTDLITSATQQLIDARRYSTWRRTPAPRRPFREKLFINFSLTREGYSLLDIAEDKLPHEMNQFFRQGRSAGPGWEPPYRQPIHAMMLFALDHNLLPDLASSQKWSTIPENEKPNSLKKAAEIKELLESVAEMSTEVGTTIYDQRFDPLIGTEDLRKPVEHFGFVDGISNPMFFTKELRDKELREKVTASNRKFNPSTPLDTVLIEDPNGTPYGHGSYLVFLKLEQHVDQFDILADQLRKTLNVDQELGEALIIGRFREGTPVALQERPGLGAVNNFDYSSIDPEGMRCPLHAHIRKVNRRRSLEADIRIVRRGITYGTRDVRYDEKGNMILGKTTGPVGLLFMSYQNDISNFETLFGKWAQEDEPRHNAGFDPIIGHGNNDQLWPKYGQQPSFKSFRFADVVTERGGQYFFAPSVSFLKNL